MMPQPNNPLPIPLLPNSGVRTRQAMAWLTWIKKENGEEVYRYGDLREVTKARLKFVDPAQLNPSVKLQLAIAWNAGMADPLCPQYLTQQPDPWSKIWPARSRKGTTRLIRLRTP
jgi:hypothetical protein